MFDPVGRATDITYISMACGWVYPPAICLAVLVQVVQAANSAGASIAGAMKDPKALAKALNVPLVHLIDSEKFKGMEEG